MKEQGRQEIMFQKENVHKNQMKKQRGNRGNKQEDDVENEECDEGLVREEKGRIKEDDAREREC
jgi:hypothetical protein